MKKTFCIIVALACALLTVSCGNNPSSDEPSSPDGNLITNNTSENIYSGKIVKSDDNSILIASDTGLCQISVGDIEIITADGTKLQTSELSNGMLIDVSYSGYIMETYPLQISAEKICVTGAEDDLTGFYLGVIDELYKKDQGLNSGISIIAFDLTELSSLSDAEKSALTWLCHEKFELEAVQSTFDLLVEQGYINREKAEFESGLLFTLSESDQTTSQFKFTATKWRSGLGAYTFYDCSASKDENGWSYTIGSEMVS